MFKYFISFLSIGKKGHQDYGNAVISSESKIMDSEQVDKLTAKIAKEHAFKKVFLTGINYLGELSEVDSELVNSREKELVALENNGLLLRLPCKVGTKVYTISSDQRNMEGYDVVDTDSGTAFIAKFEPNMTSTYKKLWFLTVEELEASIK